MKQKPRFCELKITDIEIPEDHNPRMKFDEQALFDLGESMQANTQLAPIIINRIDGKNMLIAGERRLRAAKQIGAEFIEAKIFENLDALTAMRMTLAENRDRKSLNVIEQAKAYNKLIEHGVTEAEIAESEHMAPETVRRRLALLELPKDVQLMIVRDVNPLPIHQALLLKDLSTSEQIKIARDAAPVTGPVASEDTVRAWVEDIKNPPLKPAKVSNPQPDEPEADDGKPETPAPDLGDKPKPAEPKSKTTPKAKPVQAGIGINGKLSISEKNVDDLYFMITSATVVVRIGDDLVSLNVKHLMLSGIEADNIKAIEKMVKKAQKPKSKSKKKGK